MKVLIAIGMVIIFISVFFMMFIFDCLIRQETTCFISTENCDKCSFGVSFVVGVFMIALFGIIDAVTLYLIFVNAIQRRAYRPLG